MVRSRWAVMAPMPANLLGKIVIYFFFNMEWGAEKEAISLALSYLSLWKSETQIQTSAHDGYSVCSV